ncbi:hypothetical protein [Nocardia salmonicida]|uniref:hypothetical protein n=1 Tax=Nocardia salmonicida TaxID=53431 RepID=UPI0007A452F6|nr:hypothetical protein [Nocardia salmonicida]
MTITDRLIAPNTTRSEAALCYSAAVAGAATAGLLAGHAGGSALVIAVVTLVGFDLFGGAVVNATDSAKRWFHRPGRQARHHLAFVAIHGQPFLLALVVPGFGWWTAAAIYGLVVAAAVTVTSTPHHLRTPVAFAATVFGTAITTAVLAVPPFLLWFGPVLLIKLLLAHLLPQPGIVDDNPAATLRLAG